MLSSRNQLVPYLDEMTSNPNGMLYAAIAIGSKIRFWPWDEKAVSKLQSLHDVAYDMHSASDCEKVEKLLANIKQQGWQWPSRVT